MTIAFHLFIFFTSFGSYCTTIFFPLISFARKYFIAEPPNVITAKQVKYHAGTLQGLTHSLCSVLCICEFFCVYTKNLSSIPIRLLFFPHQLSIFYLGFVKFRICSKKKEKFFRLPCSKLNATYKYIDNILRKFCFHNFVFIR